LKMWKIFLSKDGLSTWKDAIEIPPHHLKSYLKMGVQEYVSLLCVEEILQVTSSSNLQKYSFKSLSEVSKLGMNDGVEKKRKDKGFIQTSSRSTQYLPHLWFSCEPSITLKNSSFSSPDVAYSVGDNVYAGDLWLVIELVKFTSLTAKT